MGKYARVARRRSWRGPRRARLSSSSRRRPAGTTWRWSTPPSTSRRPGAAASAPSELALLELPWSRGGGRGVPADGGRHDRRGPPGGRGARRRRAAADRADAGAALAAAANLGGGFHHAFPSHGEGFCLYNDVAVAIRVLQRDGDDHAAPRSSTWTCTRETARRSSSSGDPSVFTFSIHQEHNYPRVKPPRLARCRPARRRRRRANTCGPWSARCPPVLASRPDLIFYLAGADPFVEDQLGGLCLTFEGLRRPGLPGAVSRLRRRACPGRHRARRRLRAARRRHGGHPRRHDRGSHRGSARLNLTGDL